MPNLASVKEGYHFFKDGIFRSDSQQPYPSRSPQQGERRKNRVCDLLWLGQGTLLEGKVEWSWEQRFYSQGLLGRSCLKTPSVKLVIKSLKIAYLSTRFYQKTGNLATFPSFKKTKKGVEKTGKHEGGCCLLLRTPRWATLGAPGCVSG